MELLFSGALDRFACVIYVSLVFIINPTMIYAGETKVIEKQLHTVEDLKSTLSDLITFMEGEPDDYNSYFSFGPFLEIYESSRSWYSAELQLLADLTIDRDIKRASVFAMQRLPQTRLLDLIEEAASLNERGKLDGETLHLLVFPYTNYNAYMYLYYDKPRVNSILHRLLKLKNFPETSKKLIRDTVLTGNGRSQMLLSHERGHKIRMDYDE